MSNFSIIDSAPVPQNVFVLDGYITFQNGANIGVYQVYNENIEQTYSQSGAVVAQPLRIDPNIAVLNVILRNVTGSGLDSAGSVVRSDTLVSSTINTAVLDAGASAVDNTYNGMYLVIPSTGDIRLITGYVGATKTVTVTPNFSSSPGAVAYVIANNVTTLRVGRSNDDGTPLALDQPFVSAQGVYSVNLGLSVQPSTVITTAGGFVVISLGTDNLTVGARVNVRLVCLSV